MHFLDRHTDSFISYVLVALHVFRAIPRYHTRQHIFFASLTIYPGIIQKASTRTRISQHITKIASLPLPRLYQVQSGCVLLHHPVLTHTDLVPTPASKYCQPISTKVAIYPGFSPSHHSCSSFIPPFVCRHTTTPTLVAMTVRTTTVHNLLLILAPFLSFSSFSPLARFSSIGIRLPTKPRSKDVFEIPEYWLGWALWRLDLAMVMGVWE
ncbi:uncharacterized protein CC84DRAFT_1226770 [Paraphaeosphaeria sporulosa]|uniref:Uncharacterized protein n=1 Tax=Paraphaeosphaeria sporulosa TaxID=1460663 RepID=A0A177CYV9_9PLEO|nr:uncharacterized protein CC84DRAFT_1226770 [Paraphaeosphaeria sporulosa]OAG12466.1 hypothetical protein CC84DRAFT_1226770 [Paraphaeosphaeria sporulosa]